MAGKKQQKVDDEAEGRNSRPLIRPSLRTLSLTTPVGLGVWFTTSSLWGVDNTAAIGLTLVSVVSACCFHTFCEPGPLRTRLACLFAAVCGIICNVIVANGVSAHSTDGKTALSTALQKQFSALETQRAERAERREAQLSALGKGSTNPEVKDESSTAAGVLQTRLDEFETQHTAVLNRTSNCDAKTRNAITRDDSRDICTKRQAMKGLVEAAKERDTLNGLVDETDRAINKWLGENKAPPLSVNPTGDRWQQYFGLSDEEKARVPGWVDLIKAVVIEICATIGPVGLHASLLWVFGLSAGHQLAPVQPKPIAPDQPRPARRPLFQALRRPAKAVPELSVVEVAAEVEMPAVAVSEPVAVPDDKRAKRAWIDALVAAFIRASYDRVGSEEMLAGDIYEPWKAFMAARGIGENEISRRAWSDAMKRQGLGKGRDKTDKYDTYIGIRLKRAAAPGLRLVANNA